MKYLDCGALKFACKEVCELHSRSYNANQKCTIAGLKTSSKEHRARDSETNLFINRLDESISKKVSKQSSHKAFTKEKCVTPNALQIPIGGAANWSVRCFFLNFYFLKVLSITWCETRANFSDRLFRLLKTESAYITLIFSINRIN